MEFLSSMFMTVKGTLINVFAPGKMGFWMLTICAVAVLGGFSTRYAENKGKLALGGKILKWTYASVYMIFGAFLAHFASDFLRVAKTVMTKF